MNGLRQHDWHLSLADEKCRGERGGRSQNYKRQQRSTDICEAGYHFPGSATRPPQPEAIRKTRRSDGGAKSVDLLLEVIPLMLHGCTIDGLIGVVHPYDSVLDLSLLQYENRGGMEALAKNE